MKHLEEIPEISSAHTLWQIQLSAGYAEFEAKMEKEISPKKRDLVLMEGAGEIQIIQDGETSENKVVITENDEAIIPDTTSFMENSVEEEDHNHPI